MHVRRTFSDVACMIHDSDGVIIVGIGYDAYASRRLVSHITMQHSSGHGLYKFIFIGMSR